MAGLKLGALSIILGAGVILSAGSCVTRNDSKGAAELPQGWSAGDRRAWYQGTQGSRLMPQAWARALERAGSEELFFTDANLARFRFLPLPGSEAGLPIGFALDDSDARELSYTNLTWYEGQPANERWLGLNCSACHTARIAYGGRETTIDGGPSLVDFQGFTDEILAALVATQSDAAKWERFAASVLAGRDTPANRDMLRREFGRLLAWEQDSARLNATPMRYGYGRLDAFGHIFNKVAQLAVYETSPRVRATPNPSDAPVSYPFLWGISRHDRLQWNGIVQAKRIPLAGRYIDVGALGRNAGEVIGVFGDVVIRPDSAPGGFRSSVDTRNLDRLETMLRRLEPPQWPASFPALDPARVEAGRALFASRGCQGCHGTPPPGTELFPVRMVPLVRDSQNVPNRNNTDPWMACNAIAFTSATGKLQGTRARYLSGDPLGRNEQLARMLGTTALGTIVGDWQQVASAAVQIVLRIDRLPRVVGPADEVSEAERRAGRLDACYRANSPLFAYKSRPLEGIWATAPYLHNGSVPTLYDLLLPAAQRPQSFNMGTREYDPVRVGYRTAADAPGNSFVFNATGPGNSNEGHDYNVGRLTDEERWALVEYMKTF
jgi:hypothetical protein